MMTAEIRVNGTLINHIYIVNKRFVNEIAGHEYSYDVYSVEEGTTVKGTVNHRQEDGALELVKTIIKDYQEKEF